MIIDLVPLEDLSPCSLICKTWLQKATPRLFHDFTWPPKSHKGTKKDEKSFTWFLDALRASPRLQGAICSLWLGFREDGHSSAGVAHTLEVTVLAAIIDLCPRLDNVTLSVCRLLQTNDPLEDGHCGRICTVSLLDCLMGADSDSRGLGHTLSLFSRIDVLRLRESTNNSWAHPITIPSPPSLEVVRIETYDFQAALGVGSEEILQYLCASPGVRASLLVYAASNLLGRFTDLFQGQLSNVEEVSYRVGDSGVLPKTFDHFPSLRRLVILPGITGLNWSHTMRDLILAPDRVEHITILVTHFAGNMFRHVRENDALDELQAVLESSDWTQLERFLEARPSLATFEIEVL